MSVPFTHIPLDDARPGMVLSDDLLDANGHILLRQGLELTAATLAALRHHRIETVAVTCNAPDGSDAGKTQTRHEQRIALLFRKLGNDEDDATGLLYQHILHYRIGESS